MGTLILNAVGGYILILLILGFVRAKRSAEPFEKWLREIGVYARSFIAALLCLVGLRSLAASWLTSPIFKPMSMLAGLLDGVSYFIHEGGHFLLAWAPPAVHLLGGTLFQFGVPLALSAWYLRRRLPACAALACFWAGFTLPSVGSYMATAHLSKRAGIANDGIHDWNWLLGHAGLMEYDAMLGAIVKAAGAAVMLFAISQLVFPLQLAANDRKSG